MVSANRFQLNNGQLFADQYYHIYNVRLEWARELLKEKAKNAWGQVKYVPIEELNASLGDTEVFVVGTLFKVMPNQPSILKDEQESTGSDNFTSDEDSMILHEMDENVQVIGELDIHSHVTGIPIALLGNQVNGGAKFKVTSVCYAGLDLSVYKMKQANGYNESEHDKALIVSGLQFGLNSATSGDRSAKVLDGLKKLRDFIMDKSQRIVRVIIAGNSVAPGLTHSKSNECSDSDSSNDCKSIGEVIQLFDRYIFTLAQSGSEINIMPGKNDPTSYLLPQQPFHPKILPKSGCLENVRPLTNPCIIKHDDRILLGTSGENVEAIRQHTRIEFSTTVLKNTLEWGHMAPSAPDNLSCFPFREKDPFVIDFEPDIYFAGNQSEFAVTSYSTSTKAKIQLISVPTFVSTQSGVSIDLDNLEAKLLDFSL